MGLSDVIVQTRAMDGTLKTTWNSEDFKVKLDLRLLNGLLYVFNPIPAGGGGAICPPCRFFYLTQKLLVWGFSDFS